MLSKLFKKPVKKDDSSAQLREKVKKMEAKISSLSERQKKMQETLVRLTEGQDRVLGAIQSLAARPLPPPAAIPPPVDVEGLRALVGSQAAARSRSLPADSPLPAAEFRASSQWGEDGIIQFLLAHVPVEDETFVEFGVESYAEANTRFLLTNNNWRGLILDGSEAYMSGVRRSDIHWRHDLTAKSGWITAENINELIQSAGIQGDIGLLSVDVDGVDYWIWKAITVIQPRIVICEYSALFGAAAVTVPYDPAFQRSEAHYSRLFYGASLAAFEKLGAEKGYVLVGTNSQRSNAFFVRKDVAGNLPHRSAKELAGPYRIREARAESGELLYTRFDEARSLIGDCQVVDLGSGALVPLSQTEGWSATRQG